MKPILEGVHEVILSDRTLRTLIRQKRMTVSPLTEEQIQPASIDSEEILIPPLSFMLATTIETIRLPGYITAFVEGRISIGRMGLFMKRSDPTCI
ncbi:dCTP deaminase domain-containing protein [Paenibacillus sp. BT-177]|uniref:dCTP deaminase n=1 Tax=Paenibacillus sp. BT-177 TaxID=2986930 RepID=UPI0021F7FD2F|nr:deoxycytidine triphosphate deaminase [Paenibacillus sp. BT-177]